MVIRTHTKFGRRMDEHSENFKEEMENIKKVPNGGHRAEEYNKHI